MGRSEAIVNLILISAPLAIGLVVGMLAVPALKAPVAFGYFTLACLLLGFVLFLAAKWRLVRRGVLFSFGSSRMAPWPRRAYRLGYAFMALGTVCAVILVIAVGSQVRQ